MDTFIHLSERVSDFLLVLQSGFHGNWLLPLPTEPTLIAKSSILLDVKPWDDETDMAKLEECVRSIQMDGLVWGQCKSQITYCYWDGLLICADLMMI